MPVQGSGKESVWASGPKQESDQYRSFCRCTVAKVRLSTGTASGLHLSTFFCFIQVTDKTGTTWPHKAHSCSILIGGDAKCDSNEDGVEDDSTFKRDRGSGVPQALQLSLLGVVRDVQGR